MIIIDYSQVAIATIFQFQNDLKKGNENPDALNIVRHAVLSGIKSFKKKYGAEYGDVVIACDGKNYWRKDVFPYYKAGRKKARSKSPLDWKLVFDCISIIKQELIDNFPYKVVCIDNAEADDVIACICRWSQENVHVDRGMFDEKEQILIISSDGDFKQLHKYDNVRQWSPIQKKFVVCEDPQKYLLQHTAKAGDDGIPNVLSADDVLVDENARQTKMMKKRLDQFIELGRDACENDSERANWDRNNVMVNFDMIPPEIQEAITEQFTSYSTTNNKMTIFNYLIKNRCKLLLQEVEEF